MAAKGVYAPWRALSETGCLLRAKIGSAMAAFGLLHNKEQL